ncbi:MAG: gamma-glutamyl-gamma-aminobutyrate hydrolase family protein [Bdellovibrionia bacterium]
MRYFVVFLLLLTSLRATALEYYAWHTKDSHVPLILPVPEGATAEGIADLYLKRLQQNSEMVELFEARMPHIETVRFQKLSNSDITQMSMLLANKTTDYGQESKRVKEFARIFKSSGLHSGLWPLGIGLIFKQHERKKIHKDIAEKFPLLVAMGGDDIGTHLYKQPDIHAQYTNATRDRLEGEVILEYIKAEKGFMIGVCRGSQLTAALLGYKLVQDLPSQRPQSIAHSDHWHEIKLAKTTHNILSSVVGYKSTTIKVNSLHHQAVEFKPGGFLELAARASDGTVEATEFKNGRGVLVQFHPELMNNDLGDKILSQIVRSRVLSSANRCQAIFL